MNLDAGIRPADEFLICSHAENSAYPNLVGCIEREILLEPIFAGKRPASPMVRRKEDFFEWKFTKKMNAVGL